MKKVLIFAALLALAAAPAFAAGGALFLGWGNCVGDAGWVAYSSFNCALGLGDVMYVNYQVNTPATNVVTLNAIMDVNINSQTSVPDFWHFEAGGCNYGFLVLEDKRPTGKCSTSQTTLCGNTGSLCNEFITAYGIGAPAKLPPNRTRILITNARAASSPVTLVAAPTKQYAYDLGIDATNATEAGGVCAGCASVISIALNSIVLESALAETGGEAVADIITSDMPGSAPGVCINAATCNAVPVQNKTWGQLKALYR